MKFGMVRVITGLAVSAGLMLGSAAPAAAIVCYGPDCSGTTSNAGTLFGQTQSYDVLLRANGKAITTARFEVAGYDTQDITSLTYTLEGAALSDISAYEQVDCSELPPLTPGATPAPAATSAPAAGTGAAAGSVEKGAAILSTDLPECYPGWTEQLNRPTNTTVKPVYYYPSGSVYHKVTVRQTGNAMTLTLPQPAGKDKSATLIVSYVATGYIHPAWGGYDFTFHTLTSTMKTSDVTVAVAVDDDVQLAGATKSKVTTPAVSAPALDSKLSAGAANSADAQAYVEGVGTNGETVKHASSLSAGETFKVSGRFAEHAILLNPAGLSLIVIGLVALVGVAVWWARRRKRTPAATPGPGATVVPAKIHEETPHGWNRGGMAASRWGRITTAFSDRRLKPRTVGWLCALLAAALIVVTSFAAMYAADTSGYETYEVIPSIIATLLVASTGIIAVLLSAIGLPLWYGTNSTTRATAVKHALLGLVAITIMFLGLVTWGRHDQPVYPVRCSGPELCARAD
jgi:hypothetical protein